MMMSLNQLREIQVIMLIMEEVPITKIDIPWKLFLGLRRLITSWFGFMQTAPKKKEKIDCKLYWTGGDKEKSIVISEDAADEWGWASNEFNVGLGQAELDSLEVRIKANKDGMTFYVATLYADVNYTVSAWESYKEDTHTTVWGTIANPYDRDTHVVYMYGDGFKKNHDYKVAYYDANGTKVQTEVTNSSDNKMLESQYDFTSNVSSAAGQWHSVVFDTTGSIPDTYNDAKTDPNYVIDDFFTVQDSAIPEFPTVVAAIAVCMLCAVAYVVMRRKAGKR